MRRTLVLRREQLTDLTTADLAGVVGADARTQADCPDNTYMCLTGYAICGSSKLPVCQ